MESADDVVRAVGRLRTKLARLRCVYAVYNTQQTVERLSESCKLLYSWLIKIVDSAGREKTELGLSVAALGVSMATKQINDLEAIVENTKRIPLASKQ